MKSWAFSGHISSNFFLFIGQLCATFLQILSIFFKNLEHLRETLAKKTKKDKKEDNRFQSSYLIPQTPTSLKELVPLEQFDVISMVDQVLINLWTFFNLAGFVHKHISTFPFLCVCKTYSVTSVAYPWDLEGAFGHIGKPQNLKRTCFC